MTEPKPEIAAAADWWARRLAGERSWLQPGDPTPTVGLTRFEPRKRTPEEVEAFRAALLPALDAHVTPHWDPSKDAQWASALRVVMVDYDPDPVLAEAAEAAGLGRLRSGELPGKTVMWIDPGSGNRPGGLRREPDAGVGPPGLEPAVVRGTSHGA